MLFEFLRKLLHKKDKPNTWIAPETKAPVKLRVIEANYTIKKRKWNRHKNRIARKSRMYNFSHR